MSKKYLYSLLAVLIVAATALSACGPAATPTAAATQAPAATTAPATQAPAATTAPAAAKIAILLPETKTARYESQDLPKFKAS